MQADSGTKDGSKEKPDPEEILQKINTQKAEVRAIELDLVYFR
jgi:hypothetical protein